VEHPREKAVPDHIRIVDLSCDIGEATTDAEEEVEAQIWPLITSANVACGGHVGDDRSMHASVERARALGVTLGAHPSYPDRENFGRKTLSIARRALHKAIVDQIQALASIAAGAGVRLEHVKPHGALYNDAHHDRALAELITSAVATVDSSLAVVAGSQSQLSSAALEVKLPFIAEAFADRRYRADGSLVPRSEADALLLEEEEAAEQAASLVRDRRLVTSHGRTLELLFDTLCMHADMPRSVERLRAIRRRIESEGFTVSSQARRMRP